MASWIRLTLLNCIVVSHDRKTHNGSMLHWIYQWFVHLFLLPKCCCWKQGTGLLCNCISPLSSFSTLQSALLLLNWPKPAALQAPFPFVLKHIWMPFTCISPIMPLESVSSIGQGVCVFIIAGWHRSALMSAYQQRWSFPPVVWSFISWDRVGPLLLTLSSTSTHTTVMLAIYLILARLSLLGHKKNLLGCG